MGLLASLAAYTARLRSDAEKEGAISSPCPHCGLPPDRTLSPPRPPKTADERRVGDLDLPEWMTRKLAFLGVKIVGQLDCRPTPFPEVSPKWRPRFQPEEREQIMAAAAKLRAEHATTATA